MVNVKKLSIGKIKSETTVLMDLHSIIDYSSNISTGLSGAVSSISELRKACVH